MAPFLSHLDDDRRRALERLEELAATWEQVRAATGEPPGAGGLVADDLARLRAELERRHVTIGLFGLVKRGKSTLLNALLGRELSPTHVTPETAVPVHVEHGDHATATVHLASGEELDVAPGEVVLWTSQKHNAGNHKGVTHVQWRIPSELLAPGVRMVDTPGLDDAHADGLYTRRTVQELQAADAGIVVFMSPPTVGATEMAFLADVAAADLRRTVLVANMVPQHFHDPTTREEVLAYVRRHVAARVGDDVHVHPVCAEEAWQARRFGDHESFVRSGAADVLAAVEETITATTGHRLLQRVEATLDRTTRVAAAAVELRLQALRAGDDEDRREDVRRRHLGLLDDVDDLLERRLAEATGFQASLHARVHQSVMRARAAVHDATGPADLEDVLARFGREVEVVTEDAYRAMHARVMAVHAEVDERLDDGVSATLHELGAGRSSVPPTRPVALEPPASHRVDRTAVQGAAVGGLVAGGAGLALVGAALGPVGLLAGAVAGWRLGGALRRERELRPLKAELDDQLVEVAAAVLHALDARVADLVTAVRRTSRARRAGFAVDLAATLATQDRCPPGSAERAAAVERLGVLAARLRHDPALAVAIDLALDEGEGGTGPTSDVDEVPALTSVGGDGLEPPTYAL